MRALYLYTHRGVSRCEENRSSAYTKKDLQGLCQRTLENRVSYFWLKQIRDAPYFQNRAVLKDSIFLKLSNVR